MSFLSLKLICIEKRESLKIVLNVIEICVIYFGF